MAELKEQLVINEKEYILYDEQIGKCNAEFSASIIEDRIPKCKPEIVNVEGTELWGIYVLSHMG